MYNYKFQILFKASRRTDRRLVFSRDIYYGKLSQFFFESTGQDLKSGEKDSRVNFKSAFRSIVAEMATSFLTTVAAAVSVALFTPES